MKTITTMGFLALVVFASGCQTAAERAAYDDSTCRSYGAKPGTDVYVQCRAMTENTRAAQQSAQAQRAMAIQQTQANIQAAMARTYNSFQY